MSDEENSRFERGTEIVREASGATVGALVGLAVGGPPGALVGAAVGPAATAVLAMAERAARRRLRRAAETLEAAAELSGNSVEDLEARLQQNDDRLEVALAALSAASTTTVHEKLDALAAAVAAVAESDTEHLDRIALVVQALAQLDRIHVTVLRLVAGFGDGVSPDQLENAVGSPAFELRPVVRVLELHGLIADRSRLEPSRALVSWEVTPLGGLCLELLEARTKRRKDA